MLDRELERERRLNMKEAKEEVWKRWRQAKGRRKTNPHRNKDVRSLEEKLRRVEREVEDYEAELHRLR